MLFEKLFSLFLGHCVVGAACVGVHHPRQIIHIDPFERILQSVIKRNVRPVVNIGVPLELIWRLIGSPTCAGLRLFLPGFHDTIAVIFAFRYFFPVPSIRHLLLPLRMLHFELLQLHLLHILKHASHNLRRPIVVVRRLVQLIQVLVELGHQVADLKEIPAALEQYLDVVFHFADHFGQSVLLFLLDVVLEGHLLQLLPKILGVFSMLLLRVRQLFCDVGADVADRARQVLLLPCLVVVLRVHHVIDQNAHEDRAKLQNLILF